MNSTVQQYSKNLMTFLNSYHILWPKFQIWRVLSSHSHQFSRVKKSFLPSRNLHRFKVNVNKLQLTEYTVLQHKKQESFPRICSKSCKKNYEQNMVRIMKCFSLVIHSHDCAALRRNHSKSTPYNTFRKTEFKYRRDIKFSISLKP
jgi:hypothetical protein